ncbi:MAG TPA: tetratricopeptide repeat protein [Polyangiaceae bacterium]|nr:tetratricopeptide repeat protein [Polyangiaceae bacterium]
MASTRFGIGPKGLSRGIACACLLIATGFAARGYAQGESDSDRANLLFKKGKVAFNAGKYNDALRIYTEAWSLKQSPDIAANLAQTESELGKHRAAAEHFSYALAHLLPSSTDEQQQALAEGLAQEKKEIGSLHVTLEPTDCVLTIDDIVLPLPAGGDVFVEPGEHTVSVTREGYQANRQTVHLSKGASQVLWIKLTELGATPDTAADPAHQKDPTDVNLPPVHNHSRRSMVPALVGGGVAVAGAAVGVTFLFAANSSQEDADHLRASLPGPNACGEGSPYTEQCAKLHDKNSDVDRQRTIEIVGFSVAGAAAVGTAVYLLWPRSHSSSRASLPADLSPTLALTPNSTHFGLTGRF